MQSSKEISKIYDTVLSSPGMNDSIKFDLRVTRKNVLLLCSLLESGLSADKENSNELFKTLPKESSEELKSLSGELLKKAGLNEFYEKMKLL